MTDQPHTAHDTGELTAADIARLGKEFTTDPRYRLMQNAVSNQPVQQVALDRTLVTSIDRTVSHLLTDRKVTNQKKSGRCWLFAGLNLLRTGIAAELGVKDFELSQNHLLFWDKMEKANHFLESVITTADEDVDDRTVAHLLSSPAEDGGQWNMFVALVRKHGLVPKSVMPETESSSNTRAMNGLLSQALRKAARDIRDLVAAGESERVRERKTDALLDVHRLLSIHLGTPPQEFFWQWTDDDKGFHRDGTLTPQQFAERYMTVPLEDYACLVHDPRSTSEPGRTYTVEYLGNVVGGPPVIYLNVDMGTLREMAMKTIVDRSEPVWFGCDTGKMANEEFGVWDARLYDYNSVYDTDLSMPKADRLVYHDTLMTHAMLFVGVDVVDGTARKWRVENSWGDERGDNGLWTMNDSWFAEHVFEVAVRRDLLPADLQAALDTEPVVLPAWDPMGALATG